MDALRSRKIKKILLKELDTALIRSYHQSLNEILNDLYVRGTISRMDTTAEGVFSALKSSRLLDFSDMDEIVEFRDVMRRIDNGTFGKCACCSRHIPIRVLSKHPTIPFCPLCEKYPSHTRLQKHEKPRVSPGSFT